MRDGPTLERIRTTLMDLLAAIDAASESDRETLAVLACMLSEGRISREEEDSASDRRQRIRS